ncbi:subtilisin-like protein [Anaeromyces robustus]|uniref:Subtilisin-like protein n=1 Tax=Anaeromyces robustus TaxID=1754192 RepID=A0A1Y1WQN8_9FUNG|nr:subtilisin-like protein [Anaeromyces robustus]|eukprot:ORX75608.1 subtilisin-like protein [Anaeromyces robustus]
MDEKLKELDSPEINKRFVDNTGIKRKLFFKNRHRRQNNIFKRSNNSTEEFIPIASNIVSPLCPVFNYYTIAAYLSDTVLEKVQKLPNIIRCEKNIETYPTTYYDIKEIQKETNWTGVSVQDFNEDNDIIFNFYQLSLISQGKVTQDEELYDNNYYYPSSAGKGIDIYLIDSGIKLEHDEFDTYGGTREISCDGHFDLYSSQLKINNDKFDCMEHEQLFHGQMVSSVAGGKVYGAAKKANLHMLYSENNSLADFLALDYVLNYGTPHKSIISISRSGRGYFKYSDDKIQELIKSGFIIFTSAGNDDENCCYSKSNDNFLFYAGIDNVITVGATGNEYHDGIYNAYSKAPYSNYGKCVDIYGPGGIISASIFCYDCYSFYLGTSCSTPLVAGVAATIMSDHPEIKFTNESMKEYLINLSLKDIISDLNKSTPNRYLNNGKHKIYNPKSSNEFTTTTTKTTKTSTTKTTKTSTTKTPTSTNTGKCGSANGNLSCAPGYCCSKYGYCGNTEKHCLASQGCQSKYGECTNDTNTTTTTTTKTKTTTTKTTKTTTTKTTKTSTTKTPTNTNTGKCGSANGNLSCAPGYCCSKYGYCGNTEKHCLASQGCQSKFGECTNDKTTTTTTTTTKTKTTTTKTTKTSTTKTPTSTNTGKCGSANGNLSCAPGYCCSKYGYCGNTEKHCLASQGCQSKFGECTNDTNTTTTTTTKTKTTTTTKTTKTTKTTTTKTTKTSTTKTPTNTNTGKCGSANGNLSCAPGYCCSKYGYCGNTEKHCLASQGCQSKFGECTNDKTTSTTTTKTKTTTTTKTTKTTSTKTTKTSTTKTTTTTTKKPTTTNTGKCGKEYGSCASGYCCSKYGYCGKSSEHCDTGCQKEFGKCS